MFEKTISLFDAYCQNLYNRGVAYNGDAAAEVRERLQQITYLVTRVRVLEQEVGKLMSRGTEELAKHFENLRATGAEYKAEEIPAVAKRTAEEMMFMSHAAFEAQLMTETFYYIAGRVRTVLRNKTHPIPGLNSFECVGIRNVRNKLIEHADQPDSMVLMRSFGWVGPKGPVLKAVRYDHQLDVFPDAGLYPNAQEFQDQLERLLK